MYTGNMSSATLEWPDYVVFSVALGITIGIGVYYGIKDRNAKDTETYLLAGRRLPLIPVVLSLFVGWMTSISFIGDPVEVYYYGSVYWWFGVGYCLAMPVVAHFFAPVYYKLRITSVYEYLKIRFNVYMRSLGSVGYGFWSLPFMGIGLYSPSVALSQMTGLKPWVAIVILGLICIFYTSLGGLKAVVWSDSVQAFIMLGGLIAIIVEGAIQTGGIEKVWSIAEDGGRVNFSQWGGDPLTRASGWIYLVGGFFQTFDSWTAGQGLVQRAATLPTETKVIVSMYLCIPCYLLFTTLFWLVGMVMYGYFSTCDPILSEEIESPNQLMPLLAMQTLGEYTGLAGLFLSCLCAASLSSISSGQNGLAAVTLIDTIEPLYEVRTGKTLNEEVKFYIAKVLTLVFGVINILLALLVLQVEDSTVFALTITLTGTIGGPLAGVFSLGIFTKFVDTGSAMAAYLLSLVISSVLGLGNVWTETAPRPGQELPVYTDGCTNFTSPATETQAPPADGFEFSHLYYLSPALYAPLAWSMTMFFGLIFGGISVLCRGKPSKRATYDVAELHAYVHSDSALPTSMWSSFTAFYENPVQEEKY